MLKPLDTAIQTSLVVHNLLGCLPSLLHQEMGLSFSRGRICMALSRLSNPPRSRPSGIPLLVWKSRKSRRRSACYSTQLYPPVSTKEEERVCLCVTLSSRFVVPGPPAGVMGLADCLLGPCPPCFQVHRPPEICFCGKESRVVKCVDYDPDSPGWSCGQPCSSPLDCNVVEATLSNGKVERHACQALCHAGPCPPCQIKETMSCYCGKHAKEIKCYEKECPMLSRGNDGASHSRMGFYQCGDICGRFDTCHTLI